MEACTASVKISTVAVGLITSDNTATYERRSVEDSRYSRNHRLRREHTSPTPVAEGVNRMVKNRASGFRTLDAFADMILLCAGDSRYPCADSR